MDIFKSLTNPIILTAKFKDGKFHKYDEDKLINRIDYSAITSKHLLQQKYVKDLISKLKEFNVSI